MNTNTQTRLLHHTLLCVGILLTGTPIAHAQGQSLVAKSFTHFGNPAVIFPANKTMPSALKGVIVSPEVGRRTGAVLQAKSNKELMAKLQRKIAAQQAKRVFFPGYYHPSLVNIHTVPYLNEVKKEFINLREDNKNMDKEDLDIIVNAIIKFADLQNDLTKNYIFDIKKFSEVNGKTGPYILYTYLRINKLLTKNNGKLTQNIYNETDRNLRIKLLEVTEILNQAAKERRPHIIANYLYELSVLANNFYQNNHMQNLEKTIKNDYNIILSFNNLIIKTLLNLLGIHIPKAM